MCGIAGIIDLTQQRTVPNELVRSMARAIIHRGPDEEGFFFRPGLALASRRLSIVGLADGQQPVTNEDGKVTAVFNGELFEHLENVGALLALAIRKQFSSASFGHAIGDLLLGSVARTLPGEISTDHTSAPCWARKTLHSPVPQPMSRIFLPLISPRSSRRD